jgi:carbonic anhydrase/acetyltransferase-like protein (isoleucine patch superfamily)
VIHACRGVVPKVHASSWIADSADVIGDVELAEESSVWFRSAKGYIGLAAGYRTARSA